MPWVNGQWQGKMPVDRTVDCGDRLVRKGGKVKMKNSWFQSPMLEDFVGKQVYVICGDDPYAPSYVTVFNYTSRHGKQTLCRADIIEEN